MVFSDYFEPTNVLYIDRGSHKRGNFKRKYMIKVVPIGKP